MTEPARKPRGRPRIPRDVQRQRLFDGAIHAIEKHGYERTRIADIVREAGMSSRAFYELFSSKEDLVAEYVERAATELVGRLREVWLAAGDPLERIQQGVLTFLATLPAIRVDLDALGGEAGRRSHEARKRAVREISRLVMEDLDQAHGEGRLATPADPRAVELIMTGLETMSLRYLGEGRTDELSALPQLFVRMLLGAGLTPSS